MGIRYYAWPIRNDLDLWSAKRDPIKAASAIDAREDRMSRRVAAIPGSDRTVPENCLGLDKAWGMLQRYFELEEPIADAERGPVGAHVLPRPGLLVLQGHVTMCHCEGGEGYAYGHHGFYGVTPNSYLRIAADDLNSVDLDDLEQFVEAPSDRDGEGRYVLDYFVPFREAISRWADSGFGCLHAIT